MGKRKAKPDPNKPTRVPKGAAVAVLRLGSDKDAKASPAPEWVEFSEAHAGHPALKADAIYALPEPLVDAICDEMRNAPAKEFFTAADEQFERDLARLGGGGFFLRRPFSYLLPPPTGAGENEGAELDELTKKQLSAERRIRQMLFEDQLKRGAAEWEIQEYLDFEAEWKRKANVREKGYAGWLVGHPPFVASRNNFRRKWAATVAKLGRFPTLPMSLMGEAPAKPPAKYRKFCDEYVLFCRQWGLHSLLTWELPVPMRPELMGPSLYDMSAFDQGGYMLFIPWHLAWDKDIQLRELLEHKRNLDAPAHLREWLTRKTRSFGPDRFARMLEVHIYNDLCLKARYADRLNPS